MDSVYEQFLELENSHLAPAVRQSTVQLAHVLDDEFFEFGSSGGVFQRADFLKEGGLETDELVISRLEVRSLGPESMLTIYLLENRTAGLWSHRSSVWRKKEDGWKLFFHQGTKTDGFNKWE